MGKTSTQVKSRWNSEHYTRITVFLEKAEAEEYKKRCIEEGLTLSEIPKAAIKDFLEGN